MGGFDTAKERAFRRCGAAPGQVHPSFQQKEKDKVQAEPAPL